MTDTANPIAAMLDELRQHGWTCQFPTKRLHPVIDNKPVPCVLVSGNLWHFTAAEVFLADDGRVFLCHDLHRVHPRDIDFAEFLRWLKSPVPVWDLAEKKKVLPGQRSLFGDE